MLPGLVSWSVSTTSVVSLLPPWGAVSFGEITLAPIRIGQATLVLVPVWAWLGLPEPVPASVCSRVWVSDFLSFLPASVFPLEVPGRVEEANQQSPKLECFLR